MRVEGQKEGRREEGKELTIWGLEFVVPSLSRPVLLSFYPPRSILLIFLVGIQLLDSRGVQLRDSKPDVSFDLLRLR